MHWIFKNFLSFVYPKSKKEEENTAKEQYDIKEIVDKIEAHDIEYLRKILTPLNPYDKSEILNSAREDDLRVIIKEIYDILEPESLLELKDHLKVVFLETLGFETIVDTLLRLENDDIVGFISNLEYVVQEGILLAMPKIDRKSIRLALTYTKEQVGRVMETDFISVNKDANIERVTEQIHQHGEEISSATRDIFVLDEKKQIIGTVSLFLLLRSSADTPVMSILDTDFKTVKDTEDVEDIAYVFLKYNLTTVPVTNYNNQMIGFISSDIAYDIAVDERNEDILRLGGVVEDVDDDNIFKKAYVRFIWLFVNLGTASISASVISTFEPHIAKHSFLAAMVPIAASIGGNSGMQTVTLTIRMIAMKAINPANTNRILLNEIGIAAINALMFSFVTFFLAWIIHKNVILALIFATAISANILLSALFGFLIPLGMKKIGTDPAITSTIVLTTITDCIGFALFLYLTTIFFK